MAMPIASTPPLTVKEAKIFLKEVEEGLKKPVSIFLPDITRAEEKIKENALKAKK